MKQTMVWVTVIGMVLAFGGSASLFTNAASAAETNPDISVPAVRGKGFADAATGAPGKQVSDEELAKTILNPVGALISVPVIFLGDYGIGPDNGKRMTLSIQPVIPIELNKDWNLISRSLIPLMKQRDIPAGTEDSGLGDILTTLYLSPVKPTSGGWIWGAGGAFLFPTATEDALGGKQWAIGPTIVVLKQEKGWTYGGLVTQTWSVAGDDSRDKVNMLFLQPFVGYTTTAGWNYTTWTETSYYWDRRSGDKNATQLYFTAAKVVTIGKQRVQFEAGPNYWIADTDASPSGWGWRANFVLLYPK